MTTSGGATSPDQVVEKARELLEQSRLAAVREVAQAQADVESAARTLQLAEAGLRGAWRSATRAGWTDVELRRLGLVEPAGLGRRLSRSSQRQADAVAARMREAGITSAGVGEGSG